MPSALASRLADTIAANVATKPPQLCCPQCGAPIQPVEDDPFLSCSFCGSHVFLDAAGAVRHFLVEPSIDAGTATSALVRWLKSREVVGRIVPASSDLVFFPLWQVTMRGRTIAVPAAGALFEGLDRIDVPSGDQKVYALERVKGAHGEPARVIESSVPLAAALSRAAARTSDLSASKIALRGAADLADSSLVPDHEARLVHVPLFIIQYPFHETTYTAAVSASSGDVYPVTAPRSSESRIDAAFAWLLAGGLALNLIALLFFGMAPLFSVALLGGIAWALYATGANLARRMES